MFGVQKAANGDEGYNHDEAKCLEVQDSDDPEDSKDGVGQRDELLGVVEAKEAGWILMICRRII
jgi:hypothetical protein